MLLLCLYAPFAVTQTLFLTTRNRQRSRQSNPRASRSPLPCGNGFDFRLCKNRFDRTPVNVAMPSAAISAWLGDHGLIDEEISSSKLEFERDLFAASLDELNAMDILEERPPCSLCDDPFPDRLLLFLRLQSDEELELLYVRISTFSEELEQSLIGDIEEHTPRREEVPRR